MPIHGEVIEQKILVIKEDIKNESTVTNNVKADHKGDWQCYVCGDLKPSKTEITSHIKSSHYPKTKESMMGPPRQHQCQDCKIMFLSNDSLGLHVCGQVPVSWLVLNPYQSFYFIFLLYKM